MDEPDATSNSEHDAWAEHTTTLMVRALDLLALPDGFSDCDLMGAVARSAGAVAEVARGMELFAVEQNQRGRVPGFAPCALLERAVRLREGLAGICGSCSPEALVRACSRNAEAVLRLAALLDVLAAQYTLEGRAADAEAVAVRARRLRWTLGTA